VRRDRAMITHFDHVTLCVRDLEAARRFFTLLGFEEDKSVVISGERFARYMGSTRSRRTT
jgi:catechol 2,3-dioxygenase-like lactoylglutathione lyase family enzyme